MIYEVICALGIYYEEITQIIQEKHSFAFWYAKRIRETSFTNYRLKLNILNPKGRYGISRIN